MDELIKQIIDIEERAQEVIKGARAAKKELSERVTLDSIKMQNDIETQAQAKNESIKRIEADEVEKRLGEINAETEKTLSALEEKYRLNKDKWIEAIVSGVIGG